MKVMCFGMAKEIVGHSPLKIDDGVANVKELRIWLNEQFPAFQKYASCMIAVNQSYADDEVPLSSSDEIAIIPPVSGG